VLQELAAGSVVHRVADFFGAGGGGFYVEFGRKVSGFYHVTQDEFCHGGAADVAVANKKYFYHLDYILS